MAMNEQISCDIVKDLLPLYAEDMVGEESRSLVEQHLQGCDSCRDRLEGMKRQLPDAAAAKAAVRPLKRFSYRMLLNILGFPVWLPLLAAGAVVALALFICMWVVVGVLWCVPLAFATAGLGGLALSALSFVSGMLGNGLCALGGGIACLGLAVLLFFPCLLLTRCTARFTAFLWKKLTRLFSRKRNEEGNEND